MKLSLRLKSALALFLCIAVVALLAWFSGARALQSIEANLGTAFARNATQYNKQRILTPVLRELALSQRLADSEITRRWLLDEKDAAKQSLFFAEAERYRKAFDDQSYFIISAQTRHYFFNDKKSTWSSAPRYTLEPAKPNDRWFFSSMKNTSDFNINVDPDVKLKVTKVWFNVVIKDGNRKIGLAGTGLELTDFLNRFITDEQTGVTPMILNRAGAIQAHPNRQLIDYASINNKGAAHSTIFRLLTGKDDAAHLKAAIEQAHANSNVIPVLWADIQGHRELLAVSFIPELDWFALTAVDLGAARVLDASLWTRPLLLGGVLLLFLVLIIMFAVNHLLLTPLLKLTKSARAVADGDYNIELPPAGGDELGDLTRAFGEMAAQVRTHTDELESKVQERTRELTEVNAQMAEANQKIGDSIQYASLIQNAILPDSDLAKVLDDNYFVFWHPRDVVGGDFYVFRADHKGCLMGVVDCAGHGVPGALMTMLGQSTFNMALDKLGLADPAALLREVDNGIRALLHNNPQHAQVATHMDAGLAYVNFHDGMVTFSGAKVSLYWCDGEEVGEVKSDRFALGGKRIPIYTNKTVPLHAERTFYLTTDGLLDQAGGAKGYSFGNARFMDLLMRQAGRSLHEQRAALQVELDNYRGTLPQRDDITVLSFRFAPEILRQKTQSQEI